VSDSPGSRRLFRLASRRGSSSREVDLEIRHHLDECVDLLMAGGMSRADALREALRRFGDVERVRRTCVDITRDVERGMKRAEMFSSIAQDLRFALRGVRKNPAFAAALALTLGLGIGATTAIFSVVDAILLRPLAYERPHELVELTPFNEQGGFSIPWTPMGMGRAWAREAGFVDDLALFHQVSLVRTGVDRPQQVEAQAVTANLAQTLGVAPVLGRWITSEDQQPGAPAVVVLSHQRWREWFGEERDVLGRTVELNRIPHVVIGVMPRAFRFPRVGASDMWIPLPGDNRVAGADLTRVSVIGRLPAELPLEDAGDRAKRMAEGLGVIDPRFAEWTIRVGRHDDWRANPEVRQALWTLAAAVVLMWLIALGNGVNLLSVRSAARRREIALRMSLGASRLRLLRQLLTESVALALIGGVVAVLLAQASLGAVMQLMPQSVIRLSANQIAIGDRVLWFAFALSALTGLAVGALPALGLVRRRGSTSVSAMDLYQAAQARRTGVRRALIVAEVAVSMTLLVGAGLVINSFNRLVHVDPGFDPENLVYLSLELPDYVYDTPESRRDFFRSVEERVAAVPGVQAAFLANGLPPSTGFTFGVELAAEGEEVAEEGQPFWVPRADVQPEYFDLMGIPLVAGRTFNATDDGASRSVIIDVDMARFLWADRSPLGKRFRMSADGDWYTVVGVVGDVKLLGQDDRRGAFEMYQPLTPEEIDSYMSLAIRTDLDPREVMPAIREAVWELDPDQPIWRLETAKQALAESVDEPRFLVTLMTIAAGIALALVAVGLYGVLSFAVSQRTRELGVRIALGAGIGTLQRMVLWDGLLLAGIGVVLGLGGAVALGRIIRSLLFNVEPTDPVTLVVVAGVMLATALVACYLPARRATKVDPIVVLKAE
jgi:putative ABC transport system permease protein